MRKDYVDSCVFLGFILEKDQKCKDYVNTIGYKNRNTGIISYFVISEIFLAIMIKNKDKEKNYEKLEKFKAFDYIDEIINKMLRERVLIINKLNTNIVDEGLVKELKIINYSLNDDDIFHLIEAVKSKCDFFVTTDREIIENIKLKDFLANKYSLKIIDLKL